MLDAKIIFLILISALVISEAAMTVDQMKKSAKVVRIGCMQKLKMTDDRVNELEKAEFPDETDLKCYTACILEMMNTMKKGKVNYEAALKQIDSMMPESHAVTLKDAITLCRDIPKDYNDSCSAGYAMFQCLYKNNPNFFFP